MEAKFKVGRDFVIKTLGLHVSSQKGMDTTSPNFAKLSPVMPAAVNTDALLTTSIMNHDNKQFITKFI